MTQDKAHPTPPAVPSEPPSARKEVDSSGAFTDAEQRIIGTCMSNMDGLSDSDWKQHGFRRSTFDNANAKLSRLFRAALATPQAEQARERFCNKCGYFGPDQLHKRPRDSKDCAYLSTPIRAALASQPAIAERARDFEAWWETDGQFVRAGGGDYEKCFAFAAWQAALAAPVASNTTAEPAPIQPAGVEVSPLKTGWPPSELMQDDHGGLSKALSNTPHARLNAREAAQAIRAAASQGDRGKT